MAFFYDEFFLRFPPYRKLIRQILDSVSASSPSSEYFLDAGCGTGLLSVELAKRGYRVVGIDRSPEMLARANRKKLQQNLHHLIFLEKDLNESAEVPGYPLRSIIFSHSLYIFKDPEKILRGITSTLKKGSEVYMCNPCRHLRAGELWSGGVSFLGEIRKEAGMVSIFFFIFVALAMGMLNVAIQQRKKKGSFHCWNEKETIDLLSRNGFRLKWIRRSCLAESHLLLCAVKEN